MDYFRNGEVLEEMRLIDSDTATAMTATCPKGMDIDSFIEGMDLCWIG